MAATDVEVDFRANLGDLQTESLLKTSWFAAVTGYLWLVWVGWPGKGVPPFSAWIAAALLIVSALVGQLLSQHHVRLAAHILVWGVLASVACVVFAYPSPVAACLFLLPVILSSMLLDELPIFLVTGIGAALTISIAAVRLNHSALVAMLVPVGVMFLTALACRISTRNLHTALQWVWHGYARARYNEQVARARQGELRRALKALDEATYRLERANYMLTLARDQAEEAQRLKQQFARNISHELRTPLNLIVGFTELMVQSPEHYGRSLPSLFLRDLHIVHRNASHLQNLVNDVLDLARVDAAQMSLVMEECDPAALVRDACDVMRRLIEARGLVLHVNVAADLPRLWLDPVRIRQVLFNLLNNAVRFTEHGSITISAQSVGDDVVFAVADTGVGIKLEEIPRIFVEFHQLGGNQRRHEGVGLGLAISRRFVQLHGGRIWVESEPGRGSTFYFSLPVARSLDMRGTPGSQVEHSPSRTVMRVDEPLALIVTGSPSAAAFLTRNLRGCRKVVVEDIEQGRCAATQYVPQLVIIDDAQEIGACRLEDLAREWGLPRTPFLVCPLPGEEPLRQRLGVEGYLIKPVSRQALLDMVRQFGDRVDSILIIDDDEEYAQMLSGMLDSSLRQYRIISATSGEEGLTAWQELHPDLVLLDLVLPDLTGEEIVHRMHATSHPRKTPIVVISGRDELGELGSLPGNMRVARSEGFRPGEVVQWAQSILNATTHSCDHLESEAPQEC